MARRSSRNRASCRILPLPSQTPQMTFLGDYIIQQNDVKGKRLAQTNLFIVNSIDVFNAF